MAAADWLADVRRIAAFRASLRRFERTTERAARAAGITPRQYLLLLAVVGAGHGSTTSASIGELAEHVQLAQSTVTGLVDRSEAAGLVRRVPNADDGRVVEVALTSQGERALERTMGALDRERAELAALAAELRVRLGKSAG